MPESGRSAKDRRQELGLVLDPRSSLTLQHQVRQKLIDAMTRGVLRPGRRLPSSRSLARQVGVSRNTISLAYDALLAAGHLVSRPRSGIFVASNVRGERVTTGRRGLARITPSAGRAVPPSAALTEFRRPPNWNQHPYPFLDGCVDPSLTPADEWREALRIAFGKRDLLRWSGASSELDDPRLSDELRTNVLTLWGVDAASDEIVCAASARHALHLAMEAVLTRHTTVWVDDAVDSDIRHRLTDRHATLVSFNSQTQWQRLVEELPPRAVVILGPRPGFEASPLTRERAESLSESANRSDALIIECVSTPDIREPRRGIPSVRAIDTHGRVLLVGALSAVAALGTPPAFLNGQSALIERIREVRRLMGNELPLGLQRAWAYFIGLGHYTAAMGRATEILRERRTALRDALNHYLHKFVSIHTRSGSSAYWVAGGSNLNATELAGAAAAVGILIEPLKDPGRPGVFCMGVTSLPKSRICEGVERLARIVRRDPRLGSRQLRDETALMLRNKGLHRAMAGTTLLYNTVYGEPCTIQVRADGSLLGRAGYANEDRDAGKWWTEGDRWFRQWHNWAYGEVAAFNTVIDGDQVRWFNSDGWLVDTAVIVRSPARRKD